MVKRDGEHGDGARLMGKTEDNRHGKEQRPDAECCLQDRKERQRQRASE